MTLRTLITLVLSLPLLSACQQTPKPAAVAPRAAAPAPTATPTAPVEKTPTAPAAAPAPARAPKTAPIVVELWHDTVCPWCRIGHAYLDEALKGFEHPVEVVYRPFLLNPQATDTPTNLKESLAAKYGAGRIDGMFDRVTGIGRKAGIAFKFDARMQTASSLRSHAVLDWAPENKRRPLLERIHKAYFEDHANIASPEVLAKLAAEVGLDQQGALAAAQDANRLAKVRQQATRKAGIRGVPHFRIGEEKLQGARPPNDLRAALDRVAAARQVAR